MLQEGFLGLWRGINTYNENLDMKLFSYLYLCVRNTMFIWIRKNKDYYMYKEEFSEAQEVEWDQDESIFDLFSQDDITTVDTILKIYKEWLLTIKSKSVTKISIRLARANIILSEAVKHDKNTCRSLEENCSINRDTISNILREIRKAIDFYLNGGCTCLDT